MAKTNYTKVEDSFNDGLRKIMVGKLLDEADAHQGKLSGSATAAAEKSRLFALHHELQFLQKKGLEPYKKLGIRRKKMAKWMEHPEEVTAEEWKAIKGFKEALDKMRTSLLPKVSPVAKAPIGKPPEAKAQETVEDTLVNTERKKSVYKRFNINDTWLPLQ